MKSSDNRLDIVAPESDWNAFWFGGSSADRLLAARSLVGVRIALAALAVGYFASHWSDVAFWFGGDGILAATSLGGFLEDADLGDSVRWRLSPLYWVDSPVVLRGCLLVGMVLAIAMPLVQATRGVTVALWLTIVWLANRAMMIGGLEEVTLAWGVAYLAIAPTLAPWSNRSSVTSTEGRSRRSAASWCQTLARRLIQIQLSIVFLVTGLAMLSSLAWWDGTGVMAIVSPSEIRYFDLTETLQPPSIHEPLTHAIVLGAIALPTLLWLAATRGFGVCLAIGWCVTLAILTSQMIHFLALAALSLSFLPEKWVNRLFSRTAT